MRSKKPAKYEAVIVRMPSAMHRDLKARAAEDERSMAGVVRLALRRYLATKPHRP